MKRFIITLFAGIMFFTSSVTATQLVYEGQVIQTPSQDPIIINNRTYVAIRDVFETLGYTVEWNQEDKQVILTDNGSLTTITIDTINNIYTVSNNGLTATYPLTDKVQIVNGRTMLPLRQILESVGYELEWDDETKTTTIIDNNEASIDYGGVDDIEDIYDKYDYDEYDFEDVYDPSMPEGKLSDEETAWLNNYYIVIEDMCQQYKVLEEKYGEVDIDTASEEYKQEVINDLNKWGNTIDKIKDVDVPESLNEVQNTTIDVFKEYIALIPKMAFVDENTVDEELFFEIIQTSIECAYKLNECDGILYNLYKENNINYEKLFNTEHSSALDIL